MAKKSDAHEALSLLFHRDGAPPEMVMDGAREQIHGEFRRKCREASVYVKQIEPHSPWQDAVENIVRETTKWCSATDVYKQGTQTIVG
jgi:hypothetical protein